MTHNGVLTLIGLPLLIGVMAKSAQIGLHGCLMRWREGRLKLSDRGVASNSLTFPGSYITAAPTQIRHYRSPKELPPLTQEQREIIVGKCASLVTLVL